MLSFKGLDKISFEDLLLDEDFFSREGAARFALVFMKRLEIGMLWWKDSVLEAIEMESRAGTVANMGTHVRPMFNTYSLLAQGINSRIEVQDIGRMDIQPYAHKIDFERSVVCGQ